MIFSTLGDIINYWTLYGLITGKGPSGSKSEKAVMSPICSKQSVVRRSYFRVAAEVPPAVLLSYLWHVR